MDWFNRLRRAVHAMSSRPNEITTSQDLDEWIRFGDVGAASGAPVTVKTAQGLAAVATCVRVLSNPVASLPLRVMRRSDNRREPARDLPVYRVLHDQPNQVQTSYQWRKLMMRDLLLRGNAYSLKMVGTRGVQGLIRLHPDRVKVIQDPSTGVVTYEYRRMDGRPVSLAQERVFHVWADSDDGYTGLNPIQVYRESIGDGLAVREHGSRFFSNGARLGVVLEQDAGTKMSAEARKALREDFDALYAGTGNAFRTAITPGGIQVKTVSLSMEDAQWIETRKVTAREIFGIYGVPPHKGGDKTDATFSNVEHENLDFVISSLTPWLVCWEQAINRDLLGDPTLYAKFSVDALLRGDARSRAEALQIQRRSGVISANEWRALDDMNARSDAGGDVYIIEGNMQPNDGREAERAQRVPAPRPTETET